LTGVDTDRLPEEKARGISIALGYAPLALPAGRVSVVDVPGHERFVRTMVAGRDRHRLLPDGRGRRRRRDAADARARRGAGGARRDCGRRGGHQGRSRGPGTSDRGGGRRCCRTRRRSRCRRAPARGSTSCATALRRGGARAGARGADGALRLHVDRAFTIRGAGTVVTGTLWSGSARAATT
jgi:selenocysteine-specific elongation factor